MSDLAEIEEQTRASVNHRTSSRGRNNWGVPPNIARASASREPKKPQQPKAATKPVPEEVVTIAALPPGTVFRLVTDLDGIKEAFLDRIEDLNIPLTEVDAVAGMTRGNMQKLLSKNSNTTWSREFGWKSLHKALKGTGMVLAFIVDDEKFSPIRERMQQRRAKRQ